MLSRYFSSAVLITLCALTDGPLRLYPRERHAFTGALYYAMFAAGLYFIVASLMLITVWGAYKGHYSREFQLTTSQRTLMLQTISFLVYLLSGAAIYQRIEGWDFLDAVYWADFTLLTVGIGDFSPATHTGRALLFPFAIGGIIILGLVIGSIRSLVLDRGKVKLGARIIEKERRRFLSHIDKNSDTSMLKPISKNESQILPRTDTKHTTDKKVEMNELQRREQEFNLMRRIQKEAATRRRWTSLVISGTTWFALWFIGAAVFAVAERGQHWTYFGSLYFAYTSLLTIGYGDFSPQSNSGKAFFVFWSLLAIPSLTILISNMGDTIIKGIRDLTLLLGKLTVLPGEKGDKGIMDISRDILTSIFRPVKHHPPAPLTTKHKSQVLRPDSATSTTSSSSNTKQDLSPSTSQTEKKLHTQRKEAEKLIAKSKIHLHLHLAREIADLMTHINAKPARQYTYSEWAWYLKLLGEDESSASSHIQPTIIPKSSSFGGSGRENEDVEGGTGKVVGDITDREKREQGKERVKWSWMGIKSPLMGEKGEAEWLLERLTRRLERELETAGREQTKMVDDGAGGGGGGGGGGEDGSSVRDEER